MKSLTHSLLLVMAGCLYLTPAAGWSQPPTQHDDPRGSTSGDIPWRSDQAAGRLTEPGRSRLLPPAGDANAPAQQTERRVPDAGDPSTNVPNAAGYWWNEAPEQTMARPGHQAESPPRDSRGEIIESTKILATVGNETILAGDLLGRINQMLEPYKDQIPPEDMDRQKWELVQRMLPGVIEAKLVYHDFVRAMKPEQIEQIRVSVYKQFDEKQLPVLVDEAKLNSVIELEDRLRKYGSSLNNTRRSFFEQVAAREMIRRHSEVNEEVTHDELLAYYRDHTADYEVAARARWQHLAVHFSEFPSRSEAYRQIARMGNAVLRGKSFEAVARESSHGSLADDGGQHDWTNRGSLASEVLDELIFTLPVGKMSKIIEDDRGFHIVRVVEREDARVVPFLESQAGIREKIKEDRRDAKIKEYVERLKGETYVRNFLDEEIARTAQESSAVPSQR